MTISLSDIPHLTTGAQLEREQERQEETAWSLSEVAGRLVEVRSVGPSSGLSFATDLVLEAQEQREPVVWITAGSGLVFPVDLARNGVDFDAFALVRMESPRDAAVAANLLLRSGAFGLLVLDLGADPWFPDALQHRLVRQAEEHHTAVICLSEAQRDARALGSMVSLRAEVRRTRANEGFHCILRAERDRARRSGWSTLEVRHGTLGLR